jgi:hypothetical protein
MKRSLGLTWFAAAITATAAVAAAAGAFLLDGRPQLGLAAVMLGITGSLLGLVATPLALAPAEALRASLGSREPGAARWGEERKDVWGALARDIAAATPREAHDPGIDIRRLAANIELTLRQMGEEFATVRTRMGDAAATLDGAATSGERLSRVAEEAIRQLADAVQRTDDATGALAVLPALAAEQATTIENAAVRSLAAAEALEAAATRPHTPPEGTSPEPRGDEIALRDAAMHGAEQARRLGEAMPLLIAAVARLPAAVASQDALAGTAARLAEDAERIGACLARFEALPARGNDAEPAGEVQAPREALLEAADAMADRVASRVADIAEVMALQAAWQAGAAAEQAALRLEAAAAAAFAAGVAPAALELADIAVRLDAAASGIAATADDTTVREVAVAMVDRAEGLLVRLEGLGAAPASPDATPTEAAVREVLAEIVDRAEGLLVRLEALGVAPTTQAVTGEALLDAVAARLTTDLAVGAPAEAPMTLMSLDATIRLLNDRPDDTPPAR